MTPRRIALLSSLAIAALLTGLLEHAGAKPEKQAVKTDKPAAKSSPAAKLKQSTSHNKREATHHRVPFPRVRPTFAVAVAAAGDDVVLPSRPATLSAPLSAPEGDVSELKRAIELARRGRADEATDAASGIRELAARKLVEWATLRADDNRIGFARYLAFIQANPDWPSMGTLRRRAEAALWRERRDPAIVRAHFAKYPPLGGPGRLALARALMAQGDRDGARAYVRAAWREDDFTAIVETQALEAFDDLITREDHKARMDARLYDDDTETAMRAARRLGEIELAVAKARLAVMTKASNAGATLDAVPAEAQRDPGVMFNRIQWLRRNDKVPDAARLMLAAPTDPAVIHDLDDWWVERRLLARELLDIGDPQTAYRIARDAAPPEQENYRVEHQFTAGWIALRFLGDPATALTHFSRIPHGIANPIALARAGYWQGRAAEALGRHAEARTHYTAAARYSTAYYGQLARARIGASDVGLRQPAELNPLQRASLRQHDLVRAIELLYATDQRDLVITMVAGLGESHSDTGVLQLIGETAARNNDARAMLFLGKGALGRGFAFEHYAFPTVGVPKHGIIGPDVDRSLVYSIVRQESHFNQRTVSSANALGLMQVTPAAGRYIAKKFNVTFDQKRLLSDPVYNCEVGAAEIADLVKDYRGSYILAFVGYNAGRGRVRDWVARFGDPRDPKVDPIDWVERIPFSETRNYVQRVLENLQVYRSRIEGESRLLIEADIRGHAVAAN